MLKGDNFAECDELIEQTMNAIEDLDTPEQAMYVCRVLARRIKSTEVAAELCIDHPDEYSWN